MKEKIRSLKRLARLKRYNEMEELEKYNRKLFRYRQKDREPKDKNLKMEAKSGNSKSISS